jgi:hypothetical protein
MYCRACSGTNHGWNKVWNKENRVESRSYAVLFQRSSVLTKKAWFGKVKIKMVRSFEAFCECKITIHFFPTILKIARTSEQPLFSPIIIILYYIYIYIKQGLTQSPSPRKNLVPVPFVKLQGSEHQNTRNINNLQH